MDTSNQHNPLDKIMLQNIPSAEFGKFLLTLDKDRFETLLVDLSNTLSPETHARPFEIVAQQIATSGNLVIQKVIEEHLNKRTTDQMRFICVAIRASYFRRLRQYQKSRECLKAYTTPDERQAIPVLNHLLAISYLSGNADDAREGLVHSKNVLEHSNMKNNPGALHSAAHLLLILALNDGEAEDKKQSYLNDADVFCEKAIAIEEDRGRYFYTRARIQRAKSDYPQARKYIQHAIEIEDRDAADATLRLTDYMIEESRIESDMLRHQTHEQLSEVQVQHNHMHNELKEIPQQIQMRLDEQAKENEKRMRDAEKLTIGVLGFFAGILSLLQISSQKISQVDSAGDVVAQIGTFALIIGVFIFAGVYLINRGRSSK